MSHRITAVLKTTAALALAATTLTACDDTGGGSAAQSVHAVGSSTVYPFAKLVAENFSRSYPDMRSPLIESTGTGNGIQLFCSGLGPNTPDMANASRRMKVSEFETCASNKVDEIIELQVGLDGIAFASAMLSRLSHRLMAKRCSLPCPPCQPRLTTVSPPIER